MVLGDLIRALTERADGLNLPVTRVDLKSGLDSRAYFLIGKLAYVELRSAHGSERGGTEINSLP